MKIKAQTDRQLPQRPFSSSAFASKSLSTLLKGTETYLCHVTGATLLWKWRNCICSPAGCSGAVKHPNPATAMVPSMVPYWWNTLEDISLTNINDLSGAFPDCSNHANGATVSCWRAQSDPQCCTSSLTADVLAKCLMKNMNDLQTFMVRLWLFTCTNTAFQIKAVCRGE